MFKRLAFAIFAMGGVYGWLTAPSELETFNAYVEETNFILDDRCSAVLIDPIKGYVLTAQHCIASKLGFITNKRDAEGNVIIRQDLPVTLNNPYLKMSFQAKIIKHSPKVDLALLQIDKSVTGKTVRRPLTAYWRDVLPSDEELLRGQRIYTVGNPELFYYSVTEGVVMRANVEHKIEVAPEALKIQIDARISGGLSGGAVIDEDNRLVGIISYASSFRAPMTYDWVDKSGFAISYKTINEFLKGY